MVTMTALQCFGAAKSLASVMNQRAKMPQTTKYRIARWHLALHPHAQQYEHRMIELVKGLCGPEDCKNPGTPAEAWVVPPAKMEEYEKAKAALDAQPVMIEVAPLPIVAFGDDGGVEALEFLHLIQAGLVTD